MRIRLVAALGLASLACSTGSLDKSGTGGTGGTGGRGGGGAGGAGGPKDLVLPDCVQALVADCPLSGACVAEATDAGATQELCFASGVRVVFEGEISGTSGTKVARISNADGTPCYSLETSLSGGESVVYRWRDAAGAEVATGLAGSFETPAQIHCTKGGQSSICSWWPSRGSDGTCCDILELGNATCTSRPSCARGVCP